MVTVESHTGMVNRTYASDCKLSFIRFLVRTVDVGICDNMEMIDEIGKMIKMSYFQGVLTIIALSSQYFAHTL